MNTDDDFLCPTPQACAYRGCQRRCIPAAREMAHTASAKCWCEPEIEYTDPETGASVYVHRRQQ